MNMTSSLRSPRFFAENGYDVLHDHQIFVGLYDAHVNAAIAGGYYRRVRCVLCGIETDSEEIQPAADAFADGGSALSDSSGKNQRIQSVQRRGVGANIFFRAITK